MLSRLIKVVAWVGGGIVSFVLLLYLVAIVVNWRDAAPSAAVQQLTRLYANRQAVADEDNGYVYLMGIAAPTDQDPFEVGRVRAQWLRETRGVAARDVGVDPFPAARSWAVARPAETQDFLQACDRGIAQCAAGFSGAPAVLQAWTESEPALLPRYRELLTRRAWRDDIPGSFTFVLPPYPSAADGQRLLLLSAYALAEAGDAAAVNELLASDLRFWRGVAESTDLLITKMVATGALARHFEWGGLVLRQLPPDRVGSAVPADWRTPLDAAERSMVRVMTGEWVYVAGTLREQFSTEADTVAARINAHLARTLFLPQETSNRFAEYYWQLAQLFDAPLDRYEAALRRGEELAARTAEGAVSWSTYNLVGAALLLNAADFTSYARRINDIEGVRRATVAAVTLRAAGVPEAEVATALEESDLRRPYDDGPFGWDAREQSIVFRGLEPGARGEHRLLY